MTQGALRGENRPGRRYLSLLETLYVGDAATRLTVVCTLRGGVDEELLARAYAQQVAQHPSLRARLGQDATGHYLHPLGTGPPTLTVRPGGAAALATEIGTPLVPGGPLVRATLLQSTEEDTFVLAVDHAIADGRSALALCDGVWRRYTALVGGGGPSPTAPVRGYPDPVSDRLAGRYADEQLAAYVADRRTRAERYPLAALPYLGARESGRPSQDRVRRVLLDEGDTARLRSVARRTGVSVHGLIGGALLAAMRDRLAPPGAEPLTVGCVSPADLRARLAPPMAQDELTPAASWFFGVHQVPAGSGPIALGREVSGQLHAAVARGDLEREVLALPQLVTRPGLLFGGLVLTNVGPRPLPPTPEHLSVTDLRWFPLPQRWTPELGSGPLVVSALTANHRLGLEFPYSPCCFTEAQLSEVADAVAGWLRRPG